MVFKDREQLCLIELNEGDGNKITFERLAGILMDNPSNMVYCVKSGKLYGIISTGDIHRAKMMNRRSVDINISFTFLRGFEYMKARKLFLENDKINALPIVDEDYKLIGEYSRWDDDLFGYHFDFLKEKKYAGIFRRKYSKVAIVHPSKQISKKMRKVDIWRKFFDTSNIDVEIIYKQDIIKAFDDRDIVFFTDEDEIRGLRTLYTDILEHDQKFEWGQASTLENLEIEKDLEIEETMEIEEDFFRNLTDRGVYVLTLQVQTNKNAYWKKIENELLSKFKKTDMGKNNRYQDKFWKDFFDDKYNEEYALDIETQEYSYIYKNMNRQLEDTVGKYYNVTNGERLTVGQPKKYNNTIYFFGPCLIIGLKVEDAHTIESRLQEILNENNKASRVVNCGFWGEEYQLLHRIRSTNFKQGDIAIIYDKNKLFSGIPSINLAECLEREKVPARWFWDTVLHPNHKIFKLWAKEIYKCIPNYLFDQKSKGKVYRENIIDFPLINSYIERYFVGYKKKGTVGVIVMNCNPFTNGHRFLIEESYKKVNQLIIFVVEEDKSLFSFRERFAMVIEGTRDLKNVIVVPSGKFILSHENFPEYFLKVEDKYVSRNTEFDIQLFAELIAPRLNIAYRFVGEEKTDAVTAEYNSAMKKILPQHGIELVEIPRKSKTDGNPICATDVRTLLDEGKFDDVRTLVPETTFDILTRSWK